MAEYPIPLKGEQVDLLPYLRVLQDVLPIVTREIPNTIQGQVSWITELSETLGDQVKFSGESDEWLYLYLNTKYEKFKFSARG